MYSKWLTIHYCGYQSKRLRMYCIVFKCVISLISWPGPFVIPHSTCSCWSAEEQWRWRSLCIWWRTVGHQIRSYLWDCFQNISNMVAGNWAGGRPGEISNLPLHLSCWIRRRRLGLVQWWRPDSPFRTRQGRWACSWFGIPFVCRQSHWIFHSENGNNHIIVMKETEQLQCAWIQCQNVRSERLVGLFLF